MRPLSLVGTTLGAYRVGAELGRGGMGTVYRAESLETGPAGPAGSTVALKVFHPEQVENERAFARFRLEAEIGKEIHHPHLVRTYGIKSAEAGGRTHHFTVMELIEGRTLKDLAAEVGAFPESRLFDVADQVLDALAAIHDRGVVHRDVKPENIVVTHGGRFLLMDLGVARRVTHREQVRAGQFVGSLAYAPPEQFEGLDVGPRADLYALGISLYELATGSNPYAGLDMGAVMAAKLGAELPAPRTIVPGLGAWWDQVIQTCVLRRPAERFPSAAHLRQILAEGQQTRWWGLHTAGEEHSPEEALRRIRVERLSPLIGRDREQAHLRRVQADAERDGWALLVTGPIGAGKSRLVYEHLLRVAGAGGPRIGVGRAASAGSGSYGALAEALASVLTTAATAEGGIEKRLLSLLPESPALAANFAAFLHGTLQPGAESGFSKDALFGAMADTLRALSAQQPLILVVEDLQLADKETAELFVHLARCVRGEQILLIGLQDDGAPEDESPLGAWTGQLGEDTHAEQLTVANLGRGGTEALVRGGVRLEPTVRAVAPTLHTRTDGNPLLVLELLAHLRATRVLSESGDGLVLSGALDDVALPGTVRDLVNLRLAGLDDEQRELLETAAALGASFDPALLAAVLEEDQDEMLPRLAALMAHNRLLASPGPDEFRFASHTIYEAIYESISPALQEEYHALIADTLLETGEAEPRGRRAYDLLRHLFLAERAVEAEPFLEEALAHMGGHLSASEAAPFLEKVATALSAAAPRARLAIAMKLWSFHEMRASRADEMRVLESAAEVAEALGDPEARARVHALRAGTYWYVGDNDSAGAEASAGLALAREAGSERWEATCLHTLGVVAFRRGQVQRCNEYWRAALVIRRAIDDRRGIASTLQALSLVMRAIGEEDKVLATMEEALAIWRALGERRGEASMLMNVGNHFVDSAQYEKGLGHFERALRMHRDTGSLMNEGVVLTNLAHALNFLGRVDEARAAWERALGIFVDHGNPNGELAVRTMLGGALAEYGEDDAAREQFEMSIALAERTGNQSKLALARRGLGQVLHDGGDRVGGWAQFDAALASDREQGDVGGRVISLGLQGRAALAEGDAARAVTLLREALPDAEGIDSLAPLVLARLARAELGQGEGMAADGRARECLASIAGAGTVSAKDGPEVYYSLYLVLGEEELRDRARTLLAERAAAVRNDTYREHLLTRAWPARELGM